MLIKEKENISQYSGINNEGKNIIGILKYKNNRFEIDDILNWFVDSEWTLEDAAKLPLAYSMVN